MDFDLTDEQQLIRETAREFTDKEIVPRARENDRNDHFDLELVRKIADQGYLGAIVPREYGGAGLDYLTYGADRRGGRPRLLGDAHRHLGADLARLLVDPALGHRGAEAALPAASCARGEWLGCFGLTEPDTGSDAANQKTRATKVDGGWVDQRRQDVDLARQPRQGRADLRPDRPRARATAGSPASSSTPTSTGFSAAGDPRQDGPARLRHRRRSRSTTCEVADDALLGEVGDGFKIAMSALDSGRYCVAAGCVGICQGCVDASVAYAKEREQFGAPDRVASSSCRR